MIGARFESKTFKSFDDAAGASSKDITPAAWCEK